VILAYKQGLVKESPASIPPFRLTGIKMNGQT